MAEMMDVYERGEQFLTMVDGKVRVWQVKQDGSVKEVTQR